MEAERPLTSEHSSARMAGRTQLCFVIAPIGEPETEIRKKSDQVLRHLLKPSLEPEYEVERADQISRPGIITVQIVQRIFDADLVVADLTDQNPNVYYELAIRHATRKPAIHIISRGQDIPFDVQDMRFVPYDLADPDSLDEARKQLRENIKAIEEGGPVITPVQFAEIMQSLKAGENRDAQVRALFESLNTGMSNLQEGIAEVVDDLRQRKQTETWQQQSIFTVPGPLSGLGHFPVPASGFNFPSGRQGVFKRAIARHEKIQKAAEAVEKAKEATESKDQK